jgi:hypothetical protein
MRVIKSTHPATFGHQLLTELMILQSFMFYTSAVRIGKTKTHGPHQAVDTHFVYRVVSRFGTSCLPLTQSTSHHQCQTRDMSPTMSGELINSYTVCLTALILGALAAFSRRTKWIRIGRSPGPFGLNIASAKKDFELHGRALLREGYRKVSTKFIT